MARMGARVSVIHWDAALSQDDWSHLKATLVSINVADRRWHDLRHTAATLMLAAGVPERIIMDILGHSQLDMTRIYAHVLPPSRRDAVARVDTLLATSESST